MINLNKLVLLLKQTKLIPPKDISLMRLIIRKMNKNQKLNLKQKQFFNDVATKLSMEPMLDNPALFLMTKRVILARKKGK